MDIDINDLQQLREPESEIPFPCCCTCYTN
jgi:hypothetical protein